MFSLRYQKSIHLIIFALLCLGVYSNNFDHAYQFDSPFTITENPKLRSLTNIPQYFVDPSTYTSLRSQVDYRPVLTTSYALNYWISGYNIWSYHLTQIVLHFFCVAGLYFLCLTILDQIPCPDDSPKKTHIAMVAALLFALHPAASGVVNYLNARSSLLTAAFLFPSLLFYMVPSSRQEQYEKTPYLAVLFYTLALFTKVEAVGCLAVYFFYDVWQDKNSRVDSAGFFKDAIKAVNRRTLRRLWPFLAVSVFYFALRFKLMAPYEFEQARHAGDVGPYVYLLTQTVAWWHYVFTWFAPVGLVADNSVFPVYRAPWEGPVALALGGWLLVAAYLVSQWRARPYLLFLAVSALALLSPTSSIAPLAEMVNEHRPYMPIAILSLCWIIPLGQRAGGWITRNGALKIPLVLGLLVIGTGFAGLTYQRNLVFKTERSYWQDVVEKAPSARAYVNYGLTFMHQGDLDTALQNFKKALAVSPYLYVVHTNLAIVYQNTGDEDLARKHHKLAVDNDKYDGRALAYRGGYYLSRRQYLDALADFERSSLKSLALYENYKGMATAYAGLGNAAKAWEFTSKCLMLEFDRTQSEIGSIVRPFFDDQQLVQPGLDYFEKMKTVLPDAWWRYALIAILAERIGDEALANEARSKARRLREDGAKHSS